MRQMDLASEAGMWVMRAGRCSRESVELKEADSPISSRRAAMDSRSI